MARVPVDLIRRGVDMGTAPSTYASTQNRLFDIRRRLHLRLRDMTEDDLRRVSMCTFEAMMMQLWREGHIWTGRMLTEFVELDKVARKICMLVAPRLRRAALKKEKKLLRLLADDLCLAEDAMNVGDNAAQCRHLLNLAEEIATRGISWWWLTERLLKEATAAVAGARDDGEMAAKIALATGAFLLDQLHESGEAVMALTNAMRLSQKRQWQANPRLMMAYKEPSDDVSLFSMTKPEAVDEPDEPGEPAKSPLDSGTDDNPVMLFQCASAVLCRALIQEARRARIGCPFGISPEVKRAHQVTVARNPSLIKYKGNPFQEQVPNVEVRAPRVLSERIISAPSAVKEKPPLDFIAVLKEDIGETEVRDPSKVDSESAAGFCREAAQHARNAGRRDLEECALLELGVSLRSGQKYEEALQPLQAALKMFTEDSNGRHEIKTHFQIALCFQKLEKYKEAQEELQKALHRAQVMDNQRLIFSAHKYLGMFFLNTSQRRYATTHLALALLQVESFQLDNYQRRLTRVLTGLAGANELMPEFISLLRSTESPGQEGRDNMTRLLQWKEKRSAFWSDPKMSRVVQTLENPLPPGTAEMSQEDSAKQKRRERSDEAEAGENSRRASETEESAAQTQQKQSDESKYAASETEADTLAEVRTEEEDLPERDL